MSAGLPHLSGLPRGALARPLLPLPLSRQAGDEAEGGCRGRVAGLSGGLGTPEGIPSSAASWDRVSSASFPECPPRTLAGCAVSMWLEL